MKIGDRVYVFGYVDEIRKDCVIIRTIDARTGKQSDNYCPNCGARMDEE